MSEPNQKPIFFDESQRRGNWIFTALATLVVVCLTATIGLVVTVARNPEISSPPLRREYTGSDHVANRMAAARQAKPDPNAIKPAVDPKNRARARFILKHNNAVQEAKRRLLVDIQTESKPVPAPSVINAPAHPQGAVRAVFYVNNEKASLDSLLHHADQVTHLMPVWYQLNASGTGIEDDSDTTPPGTNAGKLLTTTYDDMAIQAARAHGIAIVPVLQNAGSTAFHPEWLHAMVSNAKNRTAVIARLRDLITRGHYQGVNIDLETDVVGDRAGLTAFVSELAAVFHPLGLLVTQDIQLESETYDLPSLARNNDFLIPMIYDEHATDTEAGPIASRSWFNQKLRAFIAEVPANKTVIGIANYGYDWKKGSTTPGDMTFEKACQIAQESQDGQDGVIKIDPSSLNPYFTYYDDSQGQGDKEIAHTVWLEDATTAYNEIKDAAPYHPRGAALWRLGAEDPSLWQFFNRDGDAALSRFNPQSLSAVTYNYFGTSFEGQGDVLDVLQSPTPGHRAINVDAASHLITGETFDRYPSQFVIRRTGLVQQEDGPQQGKNTSKAIALTFDDGPDPHWTPQILEILKRYHVPATFFVVGQNAEAHPGLLAREWSDGMEIGNHSFTHPEMDRVSTTRTKLELDATQRVIEAITGHMTTLFRAPNHADSEPSTQADFQPILDADNLGYMFIGEQIDPTDWLPGIKAGKITQYVLDNADNGNCVLLHDAGGDTRAETIKALPLIIEGLKRQGYHFVGVSALMHRTRADVCPAVPASQRWPVLLDRAMFDAMYRIGQGFTIVFIVAIILGIWRILFTGLLAAKQAKIEQQRTFDPSYAPPVSVIIAAYNEAKVIIRTIETLLDSDYPDLDVVVVDDGSRDGTADIVRAAYGDNARVTILTKENGGKASALNLGMKSCRGEIVVALDADTIFAPETVSRLVRHFADPRIGAVSGNVKVGNRENPLTIWQAIEYITSQNFDRRAFDLLNCITVVPGAVGAWRRDAVALAGLYSSQTLAEDTDLTFKVRKLGYKIVTDNSALAYTEAPASLRDLAKQRFRWAFGILQCLHKHRHSLFNPRFGAFGIIAMPSLWIYQIGFQMIAPVVDLAIIWTILYGAFISPTSQHNSMVLLLCYWLVFSAVEVAGALVAFVLDQEDLRLLKWLPLQRFVYRQLMYFVIWKSLASAFRGSLVGWGKLERRGTVEEIMARSAGHPCAPKAARPESGSGIVEPLPNTSARQVTTAPIPNRRKPRKIKASLK